jgi:SAM-dependent methyltransferase
MSSIKIFNREHLHLHQRRRQKDFKKFRFLHDFSEQQILERLDIITFNFQSIGLLGCFFSDEFKDRLQEKYPNSVIQTLSIDDSNDIELLNTNQNTCDLILSSLELHKINDLPGLLIQMRKNLKENGACLFSLFGGETLHQLREALMKAEIELYDGASPRVYPFADKQQIGSLLQRAGFSLPVVDSEIIPVSYISFFNLLGDLRGMIESNIIAARRKFFSSARFFYKAAEIYHLSYMEQDGRIPADFEMIFAIGWSPHASQQQPLRRGSAQASLATALDTQEKSIES